MHRSQRMGLADAAWLALERPQNHAVVTGVLQLTGRLDVDVLRELMRTRLVEAYPRLAQRASAASWPRLPGWHDDPDLDLTRHVVQEPAGPQGGYDDEELQLLAGALVSRPLDPERPPWQIHLVRQRGGGTALVARFHHGLADGIALATVLLRLTDPAPGSGTGADPLPRRLQPSSADVRRVAAAVRAAVAVVPTLARLVVTAGEPPTLLRGRLGPAKSLAWTRPHDLGEVRDVARALDVSINDVLLAATAGGLRRHLNERGGPVADLRVIVPVDLRAGVPVPAGLGNRFGIVIARLPVGEPDPLRRVRRVAGVTRRLKGSTEAGATFGLLRLVGALPGPLQEVAVAVLGASASAVVTNVPGPREPLVVGGCPLRAVVFWAPQVGRIGLGISLFSYAGTITVGVATDVLLGIDAPDLARAIEDEITTLRAAANG